MSPVELKFRFTSCLPAQGAKLAPLSVETVKNTMDIYLTSVAIGQVKFASVSLPAIPIRIA